MNNERIDGRVGFPEKQGLYDPALEKDSISTWGKKDIPLDALTMLVRPQTFVPQCAPPLPKARVQFPNSVIHRILTSFRS